jgi:SAM-dependent methyltransferase
MNLEEYAQMYRLEDEHWWFVARRSLVHRALSRFPPPIPSDRRRRLLDVGCGTGGTMDRLRPHGSVFGVDMEPMALEFCRQRGHQNLVLGSATALPFASASFEAAVALDVLEHIPDHARAAREIARTLVPGGLVYITVPAYRSLWSSHDVALMHQRRYVAREVKDLLRSAGLETVHLTYTVSTYLPLAWSVRTLRKRLRPNGPPRTDIVETPPWLNTLLRGYLEMEGRAALTMPAPFGLTVFAVARRTMGR